MTLEPRAIGDNLSYSQMHSLEACGWQFALTKMFGVATRNSWALVAGGAYHRATELLDLAWTGWSTAPSEYSYVDDANSFRLRLNVANLSEMSADKLRETADRCGVEAQMTAHDLADVMRGVVVLPAPPVAPPVAMWPLVNLPLDSQVRPLQAAYTELADGGDLVARQMLVIVSKPESRGQYVDFLRDEYAKKVIAWQTELAESPDDVRDLFQFSFYHDILSDLSREVGRWEAGGSAGPRPDPADWKASGKAGRKEDMAWWLVAGPEMIRKYIDWRDNSGYRLAYLNGEPAVELDVTTIVSADDRWLTDQIQIKGYIDRVFLHANGTPVVVDIKTGTNEPDSAEQLGLYATLLELAGLPRPQYGGYWMSKKDIPLYQLRDLSMYTIDYFRWKATGLKRNRDEGFLPANPQFQFCRTCEVADYCYAREGSMADQVPKPWEMPVPIRKPIEITPVRRAA